MAGLELSAQHTWDRRVEKVSFSVKHTYTTEDARQLSIRQRRCVFANEQPLETSPVYTYSACMRQCRMRLCRSFCKCVPHFYPAIGKSEQSLISKYINRISQKSFESRNKLESNIKTKLFSYKGKLSSNLLITYFILI